MRERVHGFVRKYYRMFLFLLPIATLAFIFREVVFAGGVFSHTDAIANYIPYFFNESKGSALINQSILAGFPQLVSVSAAWFDPIRQLLFHFFDAIDTYRVLVLTYLLMAYAGTYFFARRIGMRCEVAILSGMVYIFAGQVMLWSEAVGIVVYYALLPIVLLLVNYLAHTPSLLKKAVLSIGIGLLLGFGWLAGHVQFLIYVYLAIGAYWLYLILQTPWHTRTIAREAGWFCIAILISAAVGFPQIWAVLNFLSVTVRSFLPLSAVYAYSYYPQHLIQYLIPSFSIPYFPLPRAFHNYIGIIPLLIALFGFFHYKRFRNVPHLVFFTGVFLFCLIASLQYSPIAALMHYIPGLRELRETVRIMFVGDFALALSVGLVIQHLWQERMAGIHESPRFYLILKRLFVWILLPIVTAATIVRLFFIPSLERAADAFFLTNLYPYTTGGLPLEHYFSLMHAWIEQVLTQFSLLNPEIFSIFVFGILGYVFLRFLKRQRDAVFWTVLLCAVALNFAIVYASDMHGIPKKDLLTNPSTATFIKGEEARSAEPFRIATPLSGIPFYTEAVRCNFPNIGDWNMDKQSFLLHKELLDPNLFLYYGLDSLDGIEAYEPAAMSDLASYLGSSFAARDRYGIMDQKNTLDDKMAQLLARRNIYRAFNIKYIITLVPLSDPGLTETYTASVGTCKSPVYVYSLGNPWPRYFLTDTVSEISPSASFLDWMDAINTAPRPTVILQEKSALPQPGTSLVSVRPALTTDGMIFTTDNRKDAYLFIGNAWLPGYRAFLDGVETRILEANYTMMAVFVPAGVHRIEVRYTAVPPTLFKL